MNFSAKAEYGVRLMVELGRHGGDQPTSLKAIAEAEGLPLSYLEHVVANLKRAELEEIAMDEVVLALEGSIAPMECFVDTPAGKVSCNHGDDASACSTKLLWMRVQSGVITALQSTTLAELVEFASCGEPERERLVGDAAVPLPMIQQA